MYLQSTTLALNPLHTFLITINIYVKNRVNLLHLKEPKPHNKCDGSATLALKTKVPMATKLKGGGGVASWPLKNLLLFATSLTNYEVKNKTDIIKKVNVHILEPDPEPRKKSVRAPQH